MGKNQCSSKVEAMRLLRQILAIEDGRPGALPGDALRNLKRALKVLRRDRGHKGTVIDVTP